MTALKKYSQLRGEKENKQGKLFTDCGVFWAFSPKQFEEGKTELKEGEKYISIGSGGYMPSSNEEKLESGLKTIHDWFNNEIKANQLEDAEILFELENHESFYIYSIESALDALGGKYTREQVEKIFYANLSNYDH
jgi:hypothetical protein